MPVDKNQKKAKSGRNDQGGAQEAEEETPRAMPIRRTTPSPSSPAGSSTTNVSQAHSRMRALLSNHNVMIDTASTKLSQTSRLSIPLIIPTPKPPPHRVSKLSREEFRRRLIWTIDEALRIVDEEIAEEERRGA